MFLWVELNYTGLIPRPLLEYEPWSGAISSLLDLRRALYCSRVSGELEILAYCLFSWSQEKYVREMDCHKVNMLLVNKADLLTQNQR